MDTEHEVKKTSSLQVKGQHSELYWIENKVKVIQNSKRQGLTTAKNKLRGEAELRDSQGVCHCEQQLSH